VYLKQLHRISNITGGSMSEQTAEQRVREVWKLVYLLDDSSLGGVIRIKDHYWLEFSSWQAAYEFTLQRETEIWNIERQIKLLRKYELRCEPDDDFDFAAIIGHLVSVRDKLIQNINENAFSNNRSVKVSVV